MSSVGLHPERTMTMRIEFYRILVINPGSTSTKIAFFKDERLELEANIDHPADEIKRYGEIWDQFELRRNAILDFLEKN
jgi:butyrate kinase